MSEHPIRPLATLIANIALALSLVVGLVFIFGWEPGMMIFPGYLKRVTVAYYLQGLVPHAMPDDSAVQTATCTLFFRSSRTRSLSAMATTCIA